jgi:hypothetical protein
MTEREFYTRVMRENLYRDGTLHCPDWVVGGQCPLEPVKEKLPSHQRGCQEAFQYIHDKYNVSEKLELI